MGWVKDSSSRSAARGNERNMTRRTTERTARRVIIRPPVFLCCVGWEKSLIRREIEQENELLPIIIMVEGRASQLMGNPPAPDFLCKSLLRYVLNNKPREFCGWVVLVFVLLHGQGIKRA